MRRSLENISEETEKKGGKSSTSKKWLGVRLSRAMMAQVEEVLQKHPEYAWSTPNDFVRDAVRRLLEHVRREEMLSRINTEAMEKSAKKIVEDTIGELAGKKLDEKLKDVEPNKFDEKLFETLSEMLGQKVAKGVIEKLRESVEEKEVKG